MTASSSPTYPAIDASPVKSFFVTMLTRDITLQDSILDLLDNCVDGILRNRNLTSEAKPYRGYRAEIDFSSTSFTISDNCGGIPWSLHDYAFRMGRTHDRPSDAPGSVGVYGIGMKRAIFKMGRQCLISTQNGEDRYEIEIGPEWIEDESAWEIPVSVAKRTLQEDGTTILIEDLHPSVAARFGPDAQDFERDLRNMVATHYAFIIEKGLEVKINNKAVTPKPTKLLFDSDSSMKPFIFKTVTTDNVEVFLAVGFTRPIPSEDEVSSAQEETRYSSIDAGWTVVCNDRAVLYCDRTEMTGWGEAGVPRYHTQFIAVAGIVEFKSIDASLLPTTTTKRGIDAGSPLYLQIKNKMREGMRVFIDYTNRWKGRVDESKLNIDKLLPIPFDQIKTQSASLSFNSTKKSIPKGLQFKPDLPVPTELSPRLKRISFVKSVENVNVVALHLFGERDSDASAVGERCFDLVFDEAQR